MLRTERAMFRHPALRAVICNSALVRDDVVGRFGVDPRRCAVIHNGVDSDFFNPAAAREQRVALRAQYGIPPQAPVLVYVGSGFERGRGPGAARHCAARGRASGSGRWRQEAGALSASGGAAGVSERAHFTGPQRDVRSHYGLADGFILPTVYEPFGSVVGEAMACGLPVLTSTRCGGAELLEPGITGWLAAARDDEAWRRNVAAWLAARDDWQRRGELARERVRGLSEAHMVAQMLALYRDLLSAEEASR